jgi:uncharacterized iron-regulated membrane protein
MRLLHLGLGLAVGALYVLTALTGSVIVYWRELLEWNHRPAVSALVPTPRPIEELWQAVRKAHPARTGAWELILPDRDSRPLLAMYHEPEEKQGAGYAPLLVWVDPISATVIRSGFWGDDWITWTYDLHYSLLAGHVGHRIVGIGALALLVSLGSGVWAWWPAPRGWWAALTIRRRASEPRLNYDLHRVVGIYSLPIVAVLALTGVYMTLPELIVPPLRVFTPVSDMTTPWLAADVRSSDGAGRLGVTLDSAIAAARAEFPSGQARRVLTPPDAAGAIQVSLQLPDDPSLSYPAAIVWLDQYNASVLRRVDGAAQSRGDRFLAWLRPLHYGEALGAPWRVAVCLAGAAPLLLLITGVRHWRRKRHSAAIRTARLRERGMAS